MSTTLKTVVISVATAAVVAALGFWLVGSNQSADTELGLTRFPHGIRAAITATTLTVGTSGTSMSQVLSGNCTLIGTDASVTASTTKAFDCAVSNVVSTDRVMVQLATSTVANYGGWAITGSKASTTAGFITVILQNLTGANAVPSVVSLGSSTPYLIIR